MSACERKAKDLTCEVASGMLTMTWEHGSGTLTLNVLYAEQMKSLS